MENEKCYWCGERSSSADHVPPKSFFPKGKREELITVPSCKAHNEELSKLDEKFKFFFQAVADSQVAINDFEKTLRALQRTAATGFRTGLIKSSGPAVLSGKDTLAFKINAKEMDLFSEKILRGLYFHHYGAVFVGSISSTCTHINSPGFDIKPTISKFVSFRDRLTIGNVKNVDVFKYECGKISEHGVNAFAMICTFYENITLFGLGVLDE